MKFTRQLVGASLKSDLARHCLPRARRDPERKLAWVNSICFLFLVIGLAGGRPAAMSIKRLPPIEEAIPAMIEPPPPPPTRVEVQSQPETENRDRAEKPQVVLATPETPAINFSIPTVPTLIVPEGLAATPPSNPLRPLVPATRLVTTVESTGSGGERPAPPYPPIARQLGQQGTVLLEMTVDQNGSITNIEVKQSSGSPVLDRGALEYVKRHWLLPAGAAGRIYEAPIKFQLNL